MFPGNTSLFLCFADSFVKEFRVQNSMLKFEQQCILLVNKVTEFAKHSKLRLSCDDRVVTATQSYL